MELQPPKDYTLAELATSTIRLLKETNATVGVAESLTAGGVMSALTSIPGSSSAFRGGVVSYATELKQILLDVDADLIAREGVIHEDVAAQMAAGVRKITTATWGVGTTGVAGPDRQDGKPVGTVYIGIADSGRSQGFLFKFKGGRQEIRETTVQAALWLLGVCLRNPESWGASREMMN